MTLAMLGELGAGHTVTAFYEVVPAAQGGKSNVPPPRSLSRRKVVKIARPC